MGVSIGKAAYVLKVSESSLKKWEREGLIPKAPRTATNRREYAEDTLEAIKHFLETKRSTQATNPIA